MQFIIPTETFVRLSSVAVPYGSKDYPACQSVRLEYWNGRYFAVATNALIIAVEYLGEAPAGVSSAVNVALIPQLSEFHTLGNMTFDWYPEFNLLMINDVVTILAAPDDVKRFREWYNIFPAEVPSRAGSPLYMQGDLLAKLARSSPSGCLRFSKYIDAKQTAICRDLHDPNWIGGFISQTATDQPDAEPATIPEWLK